MLAYILASNLCRLCDSEMGRDVTLEVEVGVTLLLILRL